MISCLNFWRCQDRSLVYISPTYGVHTEYARAVAPPTFVGISSTGGIDAWVTGPSSVREMLFDRGRQREIERAQVEIQLLPTRGAREHAGNLRAACLSAPHPYVITPGPSGETFSPVRPSAR